MNFKSVLKPEDSIVAGVAVGALVVATYEGALGPVAQAQATPVGSPETMALGHSLTKAGWTAVVITAGIALLARDPNIAILGGAVIIAEELHYRHAIQTDHQTGLPAAPGPAAYAPVESVSPQGPYSGQAFSPAMSQVG